MSDNVRLNSGVGGDNISADDLGTSKVQNVKVAFGISDTMTQVTNADKLPTLDAGDLQKLILAELRVLNLQISAMRNGHDNLVSLRTNELNSIL